MFTTFRHQINGEPVVIQLMSLADYEALGGVYTDGGNGGGDAVTFGPGVALPAAFDADGVLTDAYANALRDAAHRQYVGALTIDEDSGYDAGTVLDEIGLGTADAWEDSLLGVWLLTDWPTEAPYAARFVQGGDMSAAL